MCICWVQFPILLLWMFRTYVQFITSEIVSRKIIVYIYNEIGFMLNIEILFFRMYIPFNSRKIQFVYFRNGISERRAFQIFNSIKYSDYA